MKYFKYRIAKLLQVAIGAFLFASLVLYANGDRNPYSYLFGSKNTVEKYVAWSVTYETSDWEKKTVVDTSLVDCVYKLKYVAEPEPHDTVYKLKYVAEPRDIYTNARRCITVDMGRGKIYLNGDTANILIVDDGYNAGYNYLNRHNIVYQAIEKYIDEPIKEMAEKMAEKKYMADQANKLKHICK